MPYGLLTLVLVVAYAGLYLARADWRRPRTAVTFTGLSFALLFVLSKGWSPQYLLWLLPLLAILWPDWRGAALALSLTFFNYLESHGFFILLPNAKWLLASPRRRALSCCWPWRQAAGLPGPALAGRDWRRWAGCSGAGGRDWPCWAGRC